VNEIITQLEKQGWDCLEPEGFIKRNQKGFYAAFVLLPGFSIPSNVGNAIEDLVERLVEKIPLNCLVFSMSQPGSTPERCSISDRVLYYQRDIEPGIFSNTLFYKALNRIISPHPLFWIKYIRAVVRACGVIKIKTLVIEDDPDACFFARRVHKAGTRMILHQHAFSQRQYSRMRWNFVQKYIDKIIFVSHANAEQTERLHGKMRTKWSVIYNGVDLDHYDRIRWEATGKEIRSKQGIDETARVFLFAGRMIPSKGLGLALRAFINLNLPDAHFMVAGSMETSASTDLNDFNRELQYLAANSAGRIHLLGNISQKILPAYYCAADYVIVPSLGSYEGLPKVVTESLAMGVPVIASDRGGTWELLENGCSGWLIPDPVTVDSIGKAITHALADDMRNVRNINCFIDQEKLSEQRMIAEFTGALKTPRKQ
jgi:glycosyltransferase involved in cell wall biosynthesis